MIGAREPRLDARDKVTGAARYPADLRHGAYLHAKVVFSDKPHARMIAIDTRAAAALPGVVAIFTAADVPVNAYGLATRDQPVLVGIDATGRGAPGADVSRWEGDRVAVVVAETAAAAAVAGERIEIAWEDLPLLADVDAARNSATLLHPENGRSSNAYLHYKIRKGDMRAGWAAADVVVAGTYRLPRQEHAYLQPEAAVGRIDENGRVTVEIAGQWAHEDRAHIAHALDLPPDAVRVVYPAIGGAFGGREDVSLQIVVALAARALGARGERRPVRIVWSREESIVGHHKSPAVEIRTRWGATREGKVTAVESEAYLDAGAYRSSNDAILRNVQLFAAGPYEIANAHADAHAVYTNNVPGGAFRGFGVPQAAFAAEAQMNKLAAALGLDPVELRLRNCLRDGSHDLAQARLPAGVGIEQAIRACAKAASWEANTAAAQRADAAFSPIRSLAPASNAVRTGRGFACAYKNVGYSFGFPERCEAALELHGAHEIARVVLRHGAADIGQGAHTVLRQMCAAALGVAAGCIELVTSDTAVTGDAGSTSASRMTWMAGNAIRAAAEQALAAWLCGERPAFAHVRFSPPGTTPLDPETGAALPNFTYGFAAECVELAVDIETGHVRVLRVVCADDAGKAVNPQQIEGQIEGGVAQACGWAVHEELRFAGGRIWNPRLSTYLIPGIEDVPERIESVIVEVPDPLGPWGARGVGEMPFLPLAPALAHALYDATGVWFDELPLTPPRVLAKLRANGVT